MAAAILPVTFGDAKEVPLQRANQRSKTRSSPRSGLSWQTWVPLGKAFTTLRPSAKTSTESP